MFEYKIFQATRKQEKKTKEVMNKKGKIETETYTEIEPLTDFYARIERTLNDFAGNGWQVINSNYSLPIQGNRDCIIGTIWVGHSTTDFDSAEFVFILQRPRT